MDPTQAQSDKANDVHSLENAGSESSAKSDNKDTTQVLPDNAPETPAGAAPAITPAVKGPKPPFLKRLWNHLNIYLLLFILLVLVATAISVALVVKGKKDAEQTAISLQGLSQTELDKLASTDVTVGSPKQTLNVEANAVFTGSVLVRTNLEVAGAIKVGGGLTLSSLTVSGDSLLSQVAMNSLTVTGPASVQGTLSAKGGLNVTGSTTFSGGISAAQITTGSLQLSGDLTLTNHIVGGGPVPDISRGSAVGAGGTASVSGSDTTGSVTINTGGNPPAGCFVTLTFTKPFSGTPHVIITPVGSAAGDLTYYVNRSTTGFSICSNNAAAASQTFGFDYIVYG